MELIVIFLFNFMLANKLINFDFSFEFTQLMLYIQSITNRGRTIQKLCIFMITYTTSAPLELKYPVLVGLLCCCCPPPQPGCSSAGCWGCCTAGHPPKYRCAGQVTISGVFSATMHGLR